VITWDEEFWHRYDEWSASTTADIDFYIDLAAPQRCDRRTRGR